MSFPTVWFRLSVPVQVNTRSPIPESPANVCGFAPSLTPRRRISANPRVIKAARVFNPSPSPSMIPEAMAITFLTAPPSSTPITSSLVYTLKNGVTKTFCTNAATSGSADAAVTTVGTFFATSLPKLGPDKTASLFLNVPGSTSSSTPVIVRCVLFSIPLDAETIIDRSDRYSKNFSAVSRITCEGTTTRTRSLSETTPARSLDGSIFSERPIPGKNNLFSWVSAIHAFTSFSYTHSLT